ncbi:MAG TPA: hypothetical protein VMH80_28770 [Bryobacteraceae bacterium]|nr:hypothetical protein [Bryobacteraceae bacterium]
MPHLQIAAIFLWMFVILTGIAIGGGIYEVRAVYPNWKRDPKPATLARRLKESSQMSAGRRFWPFVSPLLAVLSLLNIWAAFETTGVIRRVWLAAAAAVAIRSIAGYSYFVPTMMLKFEKPETTTPRDLERAVRRWTSLSPWRLYLEFPAWIAALWVLTAFHAN